MTPSELKKNVLKTIFYPFFHRKTMKHWGDTIDNFGIMENPIRINTIRGKKTVWVLYRKTVKDRFQQKMFYFDAETFNIVFIHNK